jgi:hypothetical protein
MESSRKKKTKYKAKWLKGTDCFLFLKPFFGVLTIGTKSGYLEKITIHLYDKFEVERFTQALKGFVSSEVVDR